MTLFSDFSDTIEAQLHEPPARSAVKKFLEAHAELELMPDEDREHLFLIGCQFLDSRRWDRKPPRTVKAVLADNLQEEAAGMNAADAVDHLTRRGRYSRLELVLSASKANQVRGLLTNLHACRVHGTGRYAGSCTPPRSGDSASDTEHLRKLEGVALVVLQVEPETVLDLLKAVARLFAGARDEDLVDHAVADYLTRPYNFLQWKSPQRDSVEGTLGPIWKQLKKILRTRVAKARIAEQVLSGEAERKRDSTGVMNESTKRARRRAGIGTGWVSRAKVASHRGISAKTLQRWEKKFPDEIAPIRRNGRVWYRPEDIEGVDRRLLAATQRARLGGT